MDSLHFHQKYFNDHVLLSMKQWTVFPFGVAEMIQSYAHMKLIDWLWILIDGDHFFVEDEHGKLHFDTHCPDITTWSDACTVQDLAPFASHVPFHGDGGVDDMRWPGRTQSGINRHMNHIILYPQEAKCDGHEAVYIWFEFFQRKNGCQIKMSDLIQWMEKPRIWSRSRLNLYLFDVITEPALHYFRTLFLLRMNDLLRQATQYGQRDDDTEPSWSSWSSCSRKAYVASFDVPATVRLVEHYDGCTDIARCDCYRTITTSKQKNTRCDVS